jgi:hypothetical protein
MTMPEHQWNEVLRAGHTAPVAYVCANCGERRPRGQAIVRHGELSAERRDELEQAGYEVIESDVSPSGQIVVFDGRLTPSHADERLWCTNAPRAAA